MSNIKWADRIGEISDKYIEEALESSPVRLRKKRGYRIAVAAAAVLCLFLGLGAYGASSRKSSPETSFLTVVAYAADGSGGESKGEKLELKEEVAMEFAEYAPWMSNVPAMPFSFFYDVKGKEAVIKVTATSPGSLAKYEVCDEGTWEVEQRGKTQEVKSGEDVYWISDGQEGGIKVEVFVDSKCVEKKYIAIAVNEKGYFTAVLQADENN